MMRPHLPTAVLCLAALTAPAHGAEKCLASSIDQVGQCAAFQGSGVPATIDREIKGKTPAHQPPPFDQTLAATRIFGNTATGEAWPIAPPAPGKAAAHARNASTWVLLIQAAVPDDQGQLTANRPGAAPGAPDALALLRYTPADESAARSRPTLQVLGLLQGAQTYLEDGSDDPSVVQPCHTPGESEPQTMQTLGPPFAWVSVGAHQLLTATASRSEGYAGGGGNFTSRMLMQLREGDLRIVACYSVENYQMFGGDWNPDGSRQHPETLSRWAMQVQPAPSARPGKAGRASQGSPGRADGADGASGTPAAAPAPWPDLLLKPLTRATPSGRMVWDADRDYYVPAPAKR